MARNFRLTVAQPPADLDTVRDRIEWLRDQLPQVQAAGADLVLLPELFACGYNIGAAVRERAETADGPTFEAMAALAKAYGLAIHYGFSERDGASFHNASLCVSPEGRLLVHQRKLAIPPGFERSHFTAGEGCNLFEYRGWRMATLICYDAEFPETVRHAASLGADLVLVPTALIASWAWVAKTMIPTRAYENGVYLAYANSVGVQNGVDFLGSSFIAGPDGIEESRAGAEPAIIHAELDRSRMTAARVKLPYLQEFRSFRLE